MCYSYLIQVLSMSLIVFGVTYKVFLKGILKDMQKYTAEKGDGGTGHRMLGAAPEITDEASAAVFAWSLSVVLLSLELMCLTHGGVKRALSHLVRRPGGDAFGEGATSPHWPVIVVAVFKVGLLGFTLTLSAWTQDPAVLTICGCCVVLALSATRILNYFFIHRKEVIENLRSAVRRATVRASTAVLPPANIADSATKRASVVANKMLMKGGSAPNGNQSAEEGGGKVITVDDEPTALLLEGDKNKKKDDAMPLTKTSSVSTDLANSGINSSFDAIVVADLHGIITQVNDTTVTLFGELATTVVFGNAFYCILIETFFWPNVQATLRRKK